MTGATLTTLVVVVLVLATAGMAAGSSGTAEAQADRLVVHVHEDGSAELLLVLVYDLSDDADADGFASILEDEDVQVELRDRFEERMEVVAAYTADRVDRDVRLSDATIAVDRDEAARIGVVELRVTLTNLAVATDGQLTLSEPFASGFDTEAEVHVVVPDGYQVSAVEPSPREIQNQRVVLDSNAEFAGFHLVMETSDDDARDDHPNNMDDFERDDALPGFGIVAVFLALLVTVVWRHRF